MEEVRRLGARKDAAINEAKTVLAYEVTKLVHGEAAAKKAKAGAEAMFGGAGASADIPTFTLMPEDMGKKLIDILTKHGIFPSKSEGRRLIAQGGVTLNDVKVRDADYCLCDEDFTDGAALVKKGKKKHYRLMKA